MQSRRYLLFTLLPIYRYRSSLVLRTRDSLIPRPPIQFRPRSSRSRNRIFPSIQWSIHFIFPKLFRPIRTSTRIKQLFRLRSSSKHYSNHWSS